jgi:hypothetical protein
MVYKLDDFIELAIRRIAFANWVRLIALKTTADFYGWTEVFPSLNEAKRVDYPDGLMPHPGRKNLRRFRAHPLVISRHEGSKHGYPVRLTNRFRVTNNAGVLDIANIAQSTQIPFSWLTDKRGTRLCAEHWLNYPVPDSYCSFDKRAQNY